MDCLQGIFEVPEGSRVAEAYVIVDGVRRDIPLLGRVDDRLHVAGTESNVVCNAAGAVRVERDRGGARSAGRRNA